MVIRRRLNISGRRIAFITTTIIDRKPVLKNRQVAKIIHNQLFEAADHYDAEVIAYVIMPTHIHLLVDFQEIKNMSKFMQGFKILSAKKIKALEDSRINDLVVKNGKFSLWRPRFDDLIIESREQFKIKLEYIHNNPVKAGLVDKQEKWEFSSAKDWVEGKGRLVKKYKGMLT